MLLKLKAQQLSVLAQLEPHLLRQFRVEHVDGGNESRRWRKAVALCNDKPLWGGTVAHGSCRMRSRQWVHHGETRHSSSFVRSGPVIFKTKVGL